MLNNVNIILNDEELFSAFYAFADDCNFTTEEAALILLSRALYQKGYLDNKSTYDILTKNKPE